MNVDPDALNGIRLKLGRAHQELESLDNDITAFNVMNFKPFRFLPAERNADVTEHVFRLRISPPIPVEWGVRLGEIVHNLRSALDHCIYQLTIDQIGGTTADADLLKILKGSGFPIFRSPADYANDGEPQVRHLGPEVRAYIERLQPHPNGKPMGEALSTLHELWNQDKHRTIQQWGVFIDSELSDVRVENVVGQATITVASGVLHDGAEAVRVTTTEPSPNMKVAGSFAAAVAFEPPRQPTTDEAPIMQMFDTVCGVGGSLLAAIGHQDVAIP